MEAVRVKVKYFPVFRKITGKDEEYIHLEKPDVGGLVELLAKRYRTKSGNTGFGLRPGQNQFVICVNGKLSVLECPLKDNDEVTLLPPMGGG